MVEETNEWETRYKRARLLPPIQGAFLDVFVRFWTFLRPQPCAHVCSLRSEVRFWTFWDVSWTTTMCALVEIVTHMDVVFHSFVG